MSSNEKKKTYSKEFKEEAIRLVKEDSLTCIQVERDLGIGQGTVSKWIRDKKKFQNDAFCGSGNETDNGFISYTHCIRL